MTTAFGSSPVSRATMITALALMAATACSDGLAPAEQRIPVAADKAEASSNWGQRGRIVEATVLRRYTKAEAAAALLARTSAPDALEAFDTLYDVTQYTVTYTTIDEHGEGRIASAAVFVPDTVGVRLPLVSFSHGTQTDKHKVPTTLAFINPQGVINATHGSVTVLADYLGMGVDAENTHPYVVPEADANSTLDALRAARRLVRSLGLKLDGRLFLYGYSEGGGIAMTLARIIEEDPRSGFRVTASAPMAGVYALYDAGKEALARPVPSSQGAAGPVYLLASYQTVYHIADNLSQVLVSPYDVLGDSLIRKGMTDAEAQRAFPVQAPRLVMQPAIIDAWVNDSMAPVSVALRANRTYLWAPRTPMQLYYGTADITVNPRNTIIADSVMRALGAADIKVVAWPGLNHAGAQWPSYIDARKWFDSFPVPVDDQADDDEENAAAAPVLARHAGEP